MTYIIFQKNKCKRPMNFRRKSFLKILPQENKMSLIYKKKDKKSRSKTILENWHQVHLTESYVKTTECF